MAVSSSESVPCVTMMRSTVGSAAVSMTMAMSPSRSASVTAEESSWM